MTCRGADGSSAPSPPAGTSRGVPAGSEWVGSFPDQVARLLNDARADAVPVHVATDSTAWVHTGYLVRAVDDRPDDSPDDSPDAGGPGCVTLVSTRTSELVTFRIAELALVVTIDGRCLSRPVRTARVSPRHVQVENALSSLADLLFDPDLTPHQRTVLARAAGELGRLSA